MLVLSRHRGQTITVLGMDMVISVEEIRDGKVRLGFTAPQDVRIYRTEVLEREDFTDACRQKSTVEKEETTSTTQREPDEAQREHGKPEPSHGA